MTRHFRSPGIGVIGGGITCDSLSTERQALLTEEATASRDRGIGMAAEAVAAAVEEPGAEGMKVDGADVAVFRERMGPVYEDSISSMEVTFWNLSAILRSGMVPDGLYALPPAAAVRLGIPRETGKTRPEVRHGT